MYNYIIIALLSIIILYKIKWYVVNYFKYKVSIPFKSTLDLTGMPIITFKNGNTKLNFALDTGSTSSQINSSVLPLIEYKECNRVMNTIGIEGNEFTIKSCTIKLKYNNIEFVDDFFIYNSDKAFDYLKKDSSIQLHGLIGSSFLRKYGYILDYGTLTAVIKR